MSTKLENFVIFPRSILDRLRRGELSRNEFMALCYIRLSGNPFGIAVASLENIRNDVFRGKVSLNYCNKLMLSLKRKRLIYYEERSGRRGSFEVHLGDWSLPNKEVKTLDHFFGQEPVRGEGKTLSVVSQTSPAPSQSLEGMKQQLVERLSMNSALHSVRPSYTDTETDIETNGNREAHNGINPDRLVRVNEFVPMKQEEEACWKIARALGEEHINPMLALYTKHGINVLLVACGLLQEDAQKKQIENKGAYFEAIVKRLVESRKQSERE